MNCRTVQTRLDELRTGELPAETRERVVRHLERCRPCSETRAAIDSLAALARDLRGAETLSCLEAVKGRLFHRVDSVVGESTRDAYWVAFSANGITTIAPAIGDRGQFAESYYRRFGRELEVAALPERYRRQFLQALAGEPPAHPAVDLSGLDGLERLVLEELLRIPKGEVRPYGWIARQAGRPRAARAVGTTCAHNPVPFLVPCHRVVPAAGGLGNYAFGTDRKRELLELEGVPVHELERLAESGVRYVASRTTGIFCFPTCPDARRIREPNRLLLAGESAARAAGLRPCRRCRPAAAA